MRMSMGMMNCAMFLVFIFFLSGSSINGQADTDSDVAPMERAEQDALYSAIQGFVGNQWNGSDLYPDPCGWTPIQGVSCDLFDGFWSVTDLDIGPLNDNSLSCQNNVEFRSQLFQLKHLKSLSFFSCFNSHHNPMSIPTTIPSWERLAGSLESLEFRSNPALIGEIPNSFGHLRKLRSLVLIENGLTGQIPASIGNLHSLKRLVLSGNRLNGWVPGTIGNLAELLILDFSRNSLSGPMPETLGGLSSLLKLDLSSNRMVGGIPAQIGSLKNVTLLDLRNNSFSGGLTKSFEEMDSLEELVLSNNPIGGQMNDLDWKNMKNLVILDLSKVGLIGDVPETFAGLQKLRFLDLSNNYLTGKLSPTVAKMPSISALYLNENNLTGKLEFSTSFYKKMGRRFEARNNSYLCYNPQGEMGGTNDGPVGVKPCDTEMTVYGPHTGSKLVEVVNQEGPLIMVSQGLSSYGVCWIWWPFLVQSIISVLVIINF